MEEKVEKFGQTMIACIYLNPKMQWKGNNIAHWNSNPVVAPKIDVSHQPLPPSTNSHTCTYT